MTPAQKRYVLRSPLLGLAGLVLLATASAGYAYAPTAPAKAVVNLAAAAAMLTIVTTKFMEFAKSGPFVRLCALAGIVWLSFLFIETLGEILSR